MIAFVISDIDRLVCCLQRTFVVWSQWQITFAEKSGRILGRVTANVLIFWRLIAKVLGFKHFHHVVNILGNNFQTSFHFRLLLVDFLCNQAFAFETVRKCLFNLLYWADLRWVPWGDLLAWPAQIIRISVVCVVAFRVDRTRTSTWFSPCLFFLYIRIFYDLSDARGSLKWISSQLLNNGSAKSRILKLYYVIRLWIFIGRGLVSVTLFGSQKRLTWRLFRYLLISWRSW